MSWEILEAFRVEEVEVVCVGNVAKCKERTFPTSFYRAESLQCGKGSKGRF